MRFNLTGNFVLNPDTSKLPGFSEVKNGGVRMNASCVSTKNNRAFIEMFGFKNDVIKSKDKDNNDIEIKWEDRFDSDIVSSVASYRTFIVEVNGDRKEFITEYDVIKYIADNKELFNNKRFIITGDSEKNFYNGTVSDRFKIRNIYEVNEDSERRNALKLNTIYYYTKDSIDDSDWKSEKKIIINGYVKQYFSEANAKAAGFESKGNYFVQQTIIFDCSKINFDNEKHVKLMDLKLRLLGLKNDSGKITNGLKKGKVYRCSIDLSYQNGAEEINFDESQLTPIQKEMIELGAKTIEDFAPREAIYGSRVVVYKLTDFYLREPYDNGYVEDDMSEKEMEELIYIPPTDEEFMNIPEETYETTEEEDDELEDLFG